MTRLRIAETLSISDQKKTLIENKITSGKNLSTTGINKRTSKSGQRTSWMGQGTSLETVGTKSRSTSGSTRKYRLSRPQQRARPQGVAVRGGSWAAASLINNDAYCCCDACRRAI